MPPIRTSLERPEGAQAGHAAARPAPARLAAALAAALVLPAGAAEAPDMDLLRQENAIKTEYEQKIQTDILEPILGRDQAKVFIDIELEVTAQRREETKAGAGVSEAYKEKPGARTATTDWALPGVPRLKNLVGPKGVVDRPSAARGMTASQERAETAETFALKPSIKKLQVTIFHNDTLPESKKPVIRKLVVDALSRFQCQPDQVFFRPMPYSRTDWMDDLKKPGVWLPLLYAGLLSLLLLFLFGPLARFMRRYVDALREKPAAEVNVESKIEAPEEGAGGGEEETKSQIDLMVGQKPPEPPPEAEDEDAMKKFEPFAYINEENLKRLANLFLLRREEPWLIAVVLSYLRPEYARQVLPLLPVELQAKVAMEALKVRQVTREQVVAIDNEIKENIDFVVGGMERLTQMLEEADTHTRHNILEYLKNEKPVIYDKLRKFILTFEDIAHFPDREMQKIVYAMTPEGMAKALQGASPDIVNKFLNNMSTGAASVLKENMDYTKGLTPTQIEEERAKVLDQIKSMEKKGEIALRETEGRFEGFQEELAIEREGGKYAAASKAQAAAEPAAAPNPEAAAQALQAGAQLLQAGRLDEAIAQLRLAVDNDPKLAAAYHYLGTALYQSGRLGEAVIHFEKLLQLNPDPQLRAWVDGVKAQAAGQPK